jgi:hypothetical protein
MPSTATRFAESANYSASRQSGRGLIKEGATSWRGASGKSAALQGQTQGRACAVLARLLHGSRITDDVRSPRNI